MTIYIYALIDPRNNETRWVGRTSDIQRRLNHHLYATDNAQRWAWIVELKDQGYKPQIEVLEIVEDTAANECERRWIATKTAEGAELLNSQIYRVLVRPEPEPSDIPHNTKSRSNQLRDVALRLMTPELQARMEQGDKDARRAFIQAMMAETECPWESARNWSVKALEIRQGKRTEADRRGGFNPANAGDNHWKRREKHNTE